MKKLLTTMSAVAAAMSLSAATLSAPTGTSFEGLKDGAGPYDITDSGSNGGDLVPISGGATFWETNSTATLTVVRGTSISGEEQVKRPKSYTTAD